jgi:hypothetical protein
MPKIMVFPSQEFDHIKLMQVPEDFEEHEAYRCATTLISELQENNPDCSWEDVEERLEESGFILLDGIIGPELLCHKK